MLCKFLRKEEIYNFGKFDIMPMLNILTYPDNFLRQPTKPIEDIDGTTQKMIEDMSYTMYESKGVGLAAIQVGFDKSLIIYEISFLYLAIHILGSNGPAGLVPWWIVYHGLDGREYQYDINGGVTDRHRYSDG